MSIDPSNRSSAPALDAQELEKLRVVDLRAMLRERGLPVGGRKSVLVQRLTLCSAAPALEPVLSPASVPTMGMALRAMSPLSPLAYHAAADCDDEDEPRASQEATQEEPEQAQPFSPQLEAPSTAATAAAPLSAKRSLLSYLYTNEQLDDAPPECANRSGSEPCAAPQSPAPSPAASSALRRSSSGSASPNSKKARISFGSVAVRSFRVSHGGSLSTPSKGAYPIGLSWEVADERVVPTLAEYERLSGTFASPSASPRRLSEKQRKMLLEKVDARSYFEKQASFETEREELRQLRRARSNVGCVCTSPNSCGTSRCVCFKEGLPCNDDSCRCTCETCINPSRHNFDQTRVDSYRRRRILEGAYTCVEAPAAAAAAVLNE